MPKLENKKCYICQHTINMLGGYVQLSFTKHAHLPCHTHQIMQAGIAKGRADVLAEQALEEQRRREQEEDRERIRQENERVHKEREAEFMRRYVANLPRCTGCGKSTNTRMPHREYHPTEEIRAALGPVDVVEPSEGVLAKPNTCKACVEAERIARNEAKKAPEPKKEDINGKKEDQPRDRFSLIDLE